MSISDILKFMTFGSQLAAAAGDVENFNDQLDAASVGDEVTLDIPDDHEPRWPLRLKGGHKADVAAIVFRKRS